MSRDDNIIVTHILTFLVEMGNESPIFNTYGDNVQLERVASEINEAIIKDDHCPLEEDFLPQIELERPTWLAKHDDVEE